jgi:arylsulfatase A-like enzyme
MERSNVVVLQNKSLTAQSMYVSNNFRQSMIRIIYNLIVCLVLTSIASAESNHPNFMIIFIDDMGYGDLGCYGCKTAKTPFIDQLAADGTRFTSFYAQTVCGPSRGALMTGRYPYRVGGGWTTNAEEVTIAEVLKEANYTTGCVGKWDMSRRRYQKELVPNSQGFDFYYGALGANDGNKVTLYENRNKLETTQDMAALSKLYTDKSIEFLNKNKDKPFFLYLAHTMMHIVIDASPEYRDRTGNGLYADTLQELDTQTGRLLKTLDDLNLRDNTIVLFTSDNGPWSNDHERQRIKNAKFVEWTKGPKIPWGSSGPLRGAKGSTWEGGLRVPGIVRWPGHVPAGKTNSAVLSTLDVMPTFAALAGVADKVPSDRIIDGVDQRDLLNGKSDRGSRDTFRYYDGNELQAIRIGDWKLRLPGLKNLRKWPELDRGTQETELYNVVTDISESHNVAADQPERVKELLTFARSLQ